MTVNLAAPQFDHMIFYNFYFWVAMFNIVSTLSGILMIAQKPAQSYVDSLE